MAETRDLFSQKGSIVDVQLTSKFVSEYFFLFSPFFSQEMKKHSMPHCSYLWEKLYCNSSLTESDLRSILELKQSLQAYK